jgi:glyoxylase-like metal-dependent hydrolase (beta-lactamase superfamily II)
MNSRFSRRQALGLLGLGAAASAVGLPSPVGAEKAKPADRSNPRFYRFNVGDFQLTVFNDGYKLFQPIQPFWAPQASPADLNSALEEAFLPTDHVIAYYNVLLIDTGKDVLLCDTGFGRLMPATAGHLASQLTVAGYRSNQITAVFLSHAHPDHFGGLIGTDGKPVFPSAQCFVNETEWNFWTQKSPDLSKTLLNDEDKKTYAQRAGETLLTLESRFHKFQAGSELIEGVTTELAPGHTAGHTILHIQSGHDELVHVVDLAHNYVIMFHNPDWTIGIDCDPEQAASTRKSVFQRLAAARARLIGYHLPFPGIGHIRKNDQGFEWVPEPWKQV